MKQMFFYERIVALNRERHRDLKLDKAQVDARFASETHYVPVGGGEFEQAARDYPILFAGQEETGGPILLLGLRQGVNPLVNADGRWRGGTYVPAFVRRYPFILARKGAQGDEAGGYTVCIDVGCPALNEESGEPLFDEDGGDAALLQSSTAFLSQYMLDFERTRVFQQRLEELDLLVPQDLQMTGRNGEYYTLKDFRFVDVARVNRLADAEIARLQRDGHLAWIHAHRISLGNLRWLDREPEGGRGGCGRGRAVTKRE